MKAVASVSSESRATDAAIWRWVSRMRFNRLMLAGFRSPPSSWGEWPICSRTVRSCALASAALILPEEMAVQTSRILAR